ncbi:MAG: ribonuclease P [Methanomicrobiales archaeon]|jgi:ribonuclease P protein subunit RPR2|nr:ribonuclease P [Methanomicrobiales archaeon]
MAYRGEAGQRLARERIEILFREAEELFGIDPSLSDRCVALARRIAEKHRARIPRLLRRRFCRRCGAFLVPGVNSRVRIHRGRVIVTCFRCGNVRRFMLGADVRTGDT